MTDLQGFTEEDIRELRKMIDNYSSDVNNRKSAPSLMDMKINDNNKLQELKLDKLLSDKYASKEALNRVEINITSQLEPVVEAHKELKGFIKVTKWLCSLLALVAAVVGYKQL